MLEILFQDSVLISPKFSDYKIPSMRPSFGHKESCIGNPGDNGYCIRSPENIVKRTQGIH